MEHKIKGRHDPCIAEAVPAVEAAAAIALLDLYLEAVGYEGLESLGKINKLDRQIMRLLDERFRVCRR